MTDAVVPWSADGLPAGARAIPLYQAQDARGRVLVPATDDELDAERVRNLHVVSSRPGAVRGNHVHANATERICVLHGHFVAYLEDSRDGRRCQLDLPVGQAVMLEIPPGIAHAFENVGDFDGLLLCYADRPFSEVRVQPFVLIPAS